jgi:hypothetical protein
LSIVKPDPSTNGSSRVHFEMMAGDEFEGDEVQPGGEGAAGVEEPEGGGGHRFVEAAIQPTRLFAEVDAEIDRQRGR